MHVVAPRMLWIAALFLAALLFASAAFAQDACRIPACDRPGETYNAATQNCEHNAGFPTYARSHRAATCRADETLDRATGMCVLNACGSCEAQRLCPSGWTYQRSGRDARGVYGVCGHSSGTYQSHQVLRCAEGFTLNEARGICVGACRTATPTARPDLIIRRTFLRQVGGGPEVTSVRRGQPYWACFVVANVGTAASGPFQVSGGGLGVPTTPTQAHASLAPGGSRLGCLAYSTTPAVGTYRLGVSARAGAGVIETRTDNNSAVQVVNVVP
jgi:hypothetical protein